MENKDGAAPSEAPGRVKFKDPQFVKDVFGKISSLHREAISGTTPEAEKWGRIHNMAHLIVTLVDFEPNVTLHTNITRAFLSLGSDPRLRGELIDFTTGSIAQIQKSYSVRYGDPSVDTDSIAQGEWLLKQINKALVAARLLGTEEEVLKDSRISPEFLRVVEEAARARTSTDKGGRSEEEAGAIQPVQPSEARPTEPPKTEGESPPKAERVREEETKSRSVYSKFDELRSKRDYVAALEEASKLFRGNPNLLKENRDASRYFEEAAKDQSLIDAMGNNIIDWIGGFFNTKKGSEERSKWIEELYKMGRPAAAGIWGENFLERFIDINRGDLATEKVRNLPLEGRYRLIELGVELEEAFQLQRAKADVELSKITDPTFKQVVEGARAIEAKYGIPAALVIAQYMQETGGREDRPGKFMGKNVFNIKGEGPAGTVNIATHEYINGVRRDVTDGFRAYNSIQESLEDYARLLTTSPNYKEFQDLINQGIKDPEKLAETLKNYATDPNYTKQLVKLINGNNLQKYSV